MDGSSGNKKIRKRRDLQEYRTLEEKNSAAEQMLLHGRTAHPKAPSGIGNFHTRIYQRKKIYKLPIYICGYKILLIFILAGVFLLVR